MRSRLVVACFLAAALVCAVGGPVSVRAADVELPRPPIDALIEIQAGAASYWREDSHDVWVLQGCQIRQGPWSAKSAAAVIWAERGRYGELTNRLKIYLEDGVEIRYDEGADRAHKTDANWYGALESTLPPKFLAPQPSGEPDPKPAVYLNAMARRGAYRQGAIRRTQFADPRQAQLPAAPGAPSGPAEGVLPSPPGAAGAAALDLAAPATRRVRVYPRAARRFPLNSSSPARSARNGPPSSRPAS